MTQKRKTVLTPLREEREKRGWTLDFLHACLCALIDAPQKQPISLRQIESWERGEHMPHPYWRHLLCTVYKKSAAELGLVHNVSSSPKEPSSVDLSSLQEKYLQRLSELYGTIKLPIGPAQGFSLQAVFQPLRLCQTASESDHDYLQDNTLLQSESSLDRQKPSLIVENGNEALKQSPSRRIVILGGPGTGKSTLLKYFVGNRAQEALKDPNTPLPIFVALPEFGRSGTTLKNFLLETLQDLLIDDAFVDVLWQKIQKGEALVCLDSLDEVTTGQADMIRKINTFLTSAHPNTTCVISSRFTDFRRGQFFSGQAMEWELLPLDHTLGLKLAERLLSELQLRMGRRAGKIVPRVFLKTLEMHPRIATWRKNPLLFSLAAILYVRKGQLPENRKELYLQVIDAVIELREPAPEWRIILWGILSSLAYKLFTQSKGRSFSVTDLIFMLRSIRQEQGENWQIEEVARRLRNAGLLEATHQGSFQFLHQTFQEYLAGHHVAFLPLSQAKQEINSLVAQIDNPFSRQIIIELAYVVCQSNLTLEDYLYQKIIEQYRNAKMGLLEIQQTGQITQSSALAGGCDIVLQALVDLWDFRLCLTLQSGSANRKEDGELASSLAWVFERSPRALAIPALIAGLSIYPKRARFLGALGETGTPEAQEALYVFTVEQLAHPVDIFVFRYLASALGRARVEKAIPCLRVIRDDPKFDVETQFEAHQALRMMGQESTFDEQSYYQIERILRAFSVEDEQHRPSDWKLIANMSRWLQANYAQTPSLHPHYQVILQALKAVSLEHAIDTARQATVDTLGIVGDNSIFAFLLQCLENHTEPVYDVVHLMLKALEHLAGHQQANVTEDRFIEAFEQIEHNYPALSEEIKSVQMSIQMYMETSQPSHGPGEKPKNI